MLHCPKLAFILPLLCLAGAAQETQMVNTEAAMGLWLDRFSMHEPLVETGGICTGEVGALPAFTVMPAATGERLVRVSLPFAPGALPESMGVKAICKGDEIAVDLRILTRHPGRPVSVRRAMLTFPFNFATPDAHQFALRLAEPRPVEHRSLELDAQGAIKAELSGISVQVTPESVRVLYENGSTWNATLIAPKRSVATPAKPEVIEWGEHYVWVRLLAPDPQWPRIIEVRMDRLGTVAVQAHLQRQIWGDDTAPDLGWSLSCPAMAETVSHAFTNGEPCALTTSDGVWQLSFPIAPFELRGGVDISPAQTGAEVRYLRCRADERVPFQNTAWRRMEFVIGKPGVSSLGVLLEPVLPIHVAPTAYDVIYDSGMPLDLSLWPDIESADDYAWSSVKRCMLRGDDFGNVTSYDENTGKTAIGGMLRLPSAPAIFDAAYRRDDSELRDVAALWCSNFYDLCIWWGDETSIGGWEKDYSHFGGTRHPMSEYTAESPMFRWRRNPAFDFCTKGFASFFYAYEETGDPRMATALHWQVEYARQHMHSNQPPGNTRNVGAVEDFLRLFRFTGVRSYEDEAARLFRELRSVLSKGDLSTQSGEPIVENLPFLEEDARGYKFPFAKPYILSYALMGLPHLLQELPDEPKLRDTVRAVADFLAESQDPTGGWRYPHPKSSRNSFSQSAECAAEIARAAQVLEARGEAIDGLLDAIERAIQSYISAYERTGMFLQSVQGWEMSSGVIKQAEDIYPLYEHPEDRDPARDYSEGKVTLGSVVPETLVHLWEALRFYLKHRPGERLLHTPERLGQVLNRVDDRRIRLTPLDAGTYIRLSRPDNPEAQVILWGPEFVNLPNLSYADLHQCKVDWRRDEVTQTLSFVIERDEAVLMATFVPRLDSVECSYTVVPKEGTTPPDVLKLGPCTQMKGGLFEGNDQDLLNRIWYLKDGSWLSLGEQVEGNARNFTFIEGLPSPEMNEDMRNAGWKTLQTSRPDRPLIVCTSADGVWVTGTASECCDSIANNANASHRCIHSQAQMPLRRNGPTTVRTNVYLMKGGLAALKSRYEKDAARWLQVPAAPPAPATYFDAYGVRDRMPSYYDRRIREMRFPMSWREANMRFDKWRTAARKILLAHFLTPPARVPFEATILEVEQRNTYEARKIAFNISSHCRVPAYLLVPKGQGPFPGIIALHDHGAHFSIGKEKVVLPFNAPAGFAEDAQDWTSKYYAGRYIGDELAKRGYVVLAIDATYWGDRGRKEGVDFQEQQALAANMFQLGYSWAGYNAWDDIRSAEYLQGLPMVDPNRIGCLGLSMGAYRTWQLSAATDIVKAAVVVCWMCDLEGFMVPGQNQTSGTSSFTMIHPGVFSYLDYPDIASIACPKPMMFLAGTQDVLFPICGVNRCFEKMAEVWASQNAKDRLECRFYDVPHLFNQEMQEEAFAWLDRFLKL